MRRTIKNLILLVAMAVALLSIYPPFSLQGEIEARVIAKMEAAGLTEPEFKLQSLTSKEALISRVAFKKDGIVVEANNLRLSAEALPVAEILQEKYDNLKLRWALESLYVDGIAYPFPPLSGEGNVSYEQFAFKVEGGLFNVAKAVDIRFAAAPSYVRIDSAKLPWEGASISLKEVEYIVGDTEPLYVILYVDHLELAHLLQLITGEKASGTGVLSGAVPVVFSPDGGFMPGNARLEVTGGGMLSLSADALPGDNPQMALAREALTDFHYTDLILTSETDESGKLSIQLKIGGNNPNAFEGRPVKLNVNLTGDVLQLLEQTLIPSADPRKFLEQNNEP